MGGLKGVKTSVWVKCQGVGGVGVDHREVVTLFHPCKTHSTRAHYKSLHNASIRYTHAHMHARTHTTQPTSLLQLLLHLSPK